MSIILLIILCVLTTPILSTFSSSPSIRHASKQQQHGLIVKLIHRNKIDPLIYPPGSTPTERMDMALRRVTNTKAYKVVNTSSKTNSNQTSFPKKPLSRLVGKGSTFMATFLIGSDGVYQYAALDTGSQFLWVQCAGYTRGQVTGSQTYDPLQSVTHRESTCLQAGDYYCKKVASGGCDNEDRCGYLNVYDDGSLSSGYIIFDTLTFLQNDRQHLSPVTDVLFGCGIENQDKAVEDGVFGIGPDPDISIVGRIGMRFSFCFGAITDENYEYNFLALGDDVRFMGTPEPIILNEHEYHVELQQIFFGRYTLTLAEGFQIMIDSGSTFSYIQDEIFRELTTVIDQTINMRAPKIVSPEEPRALCYQDLVNRVPDFPPLYLKFQSAILEIDVSGLFFRAGGDNLFCMTFLPFDNDEDTVNMIGAAGLQFHNVGFDLNTMHVYFNKIDCQGLL